MLQQINTRRATRDDLPQLTKVLSRAFADDPVASWSFRKAEQRLPLLENFYRVYLQHYIERDELWTTDDL
ncbi:MAG: hypothetical protein JHC87_05920, partial [Thermoleophilaceae bacterium]|nr:hypothetical protein [Thermoleophilaceae bacterium]